MAKWIPVHVRRDNDSVLHYIERPLADRFATELQKIEEERGEIIMTFHISSDEQHILALVKVKENQ